MNPATIAAWLGIVVTAGGLIAGAIKFLFWSSTRFKSAKSMRDFRHPQKRSALPRSRRAIAGGPWGSRAMSRQCRSFVTNIASVPVRVPQIELRYGYLGRKRESGMVMVSRGLHENMYGIYDIPPGETRDASFDFWVYPPVVKPHKQFTARSVSFIDQFGNRQTVKRVQFRSMAADHPPTPKEPEEFPYAIADPFEREAYLS
jgi:hypothetical protein